MTIEKLKELADKSIKDTKKIRDEMTRYAKEYNGEWWNKELVSSVDSDVFVNFLFSTIESTAPLLTDNRPKVDLFAREPFLQLVAEVYSKAFEFVWEKCWMDERTNLAAKDSLIFGQAVYKVYFDPDLENKLGEVRVDLVDPREFVVSPGCEDVWDAAWCGEKRRVPLTWIQQFYPDKAEEVEASQDTGDGQIDTSDRPDSKAKDGFITVYEIWLRDPEMEEFLEEKSELNEETGEYETKKTKSKRPKYPNGRIMTFTGDLVSLGDRPSPFRHGKPPYVIAYNYRSPHSVWGMSEGRQIEALVREFNLRLRQVVEFIRKNTKINYILDEASGITQEQFVEALLNGDSVLMATGGYGREAVTAVDTPRLSGSVTELLQAFQVFIEEITGVTDVTKGQIGKKSRQSASELSILLESSYTRTRQRVRNHEFALKRVGILILELMQQYYTEPRTFRYHEDDDVVWGTISNNPEIIKALAEPGEALMKVMETEPDDLTPDERAVIEDYHKLCEYLGDGDEVYIDLDINIQTNSTLPLDHQSKANLAIRLAEMKILDPQAVLETINFPGSKKIIDRLKKMAEQKAEAKNRPGPPPKNDGPAPGENRPRDMQMKMQGGM